MHSGNAVRVPAPADQAIVSADTMVIQLLTTRTYSVVPFLRRPYIPQVRFGAVARLNHHRHPLSSSTHMHRGGGDMTPSSSEVPGPGAASPAGEQERRRGPVLALLPCWPASQKEAAGPPARRFRVRVDDLLPCQSFTPRKRASIDLITAPKNPFQVLSAEYPRHWTDEGHEEAKEDRGGEGEGVEARSGWLLWRRQRRRRREVYFPENAVSTAKYTWLTFIPRCVCLWVNVGN